MYNISVVILNSKGDVELTRKLQAVSALKGDEILQYTAFGDKQIIITDATDYLTISQPLKLLIRYNNDMRPAYLDFTQSLGIPMWDIDKRTVNINFTNVKFISIHFAL